jgi:uncharacterized protein (DUF433 family)
LVEQLIRNQQVTGSSPVFGSMPNPSLDSCSVIMARKARCPATSGHLFISRFQDLISASESGQLAIRVLIQARLRRIEHDAAGFAIRLYPFTRQNGLDQPRIIVIDPLISFGRPTIAGTGVTTSILAERYKACDSMDALADDYGCQRAQVEEAIRCELALAA